MPNPTPRKRILLVYIGFEQGAWGNIAYPKAEHYYIMPGILYCAAALRSHEITRYTCDTECLYLNSTIQPPDEMLAAISMRAPDLLGFSTFCWNVDLVLDLVRQCRAALPGISIVLGGPEVTMKDESESATFFATQREVDGLVFGEAEETLPYIAMSLLTNNPALLDTVKGFALSPQHGSRLDFDQTQYTDLGSLPSPYPFDLAVKRGDSCGLAMVYETGRGCPYRCIYCRFGHRDNALRAFGMDRVRRELHWLLSTDIECIHFADPVFDREPERAKQILRFLVDHNRTTSLFFYCSFYRLDDELAALFEKTQCQIGVGVQSTNPAVLKTIQRGLSPRLFDSIRDLLTKHHINFYTDLIFGLPGDSLPSFQRSFDDCLRLSPSFAMLFPLTLIKGTPLEADAHSYGMVRYRDEDFADLGLMCDIEYRNVALHENFAPAELAVFDDIALACFYFYNRFRFSLAHLQARAPQGAAWLYQRIGERTKHYLERTGRKASNTSRLPGFEDEILRIFTDILTDLAAGPQELRAFSEIFKLDIYRIIILTSPHRRKIFADTRAIANRLQWAAPGADLADCQFAASTFGKKITLEFPLAQIRNLADMRESISTAPEQVYLHAAFDRWDVSLQTVSRVDELLLGMIPTDRPVRYASLLSSVKREFGAADGFRESLDTALRRLQKTGVVTAFTQSTAPAA